MSGLDREQIEHWGYMNDSQRLSKLGFQNISTSKINSDGGPSFYYDLPKGCNTLNDLLEWKGDTQWRGDSFHLANITKAAWRWGIKAGTSEAYDSRKFIYSGARLLMKQTSKTELRAYLQQLLDDVQFSGENDT